MTGSAKQQMPISTGYHYQPLVQLGSGWKNAHWRKADLGYRATPACPAFPGNAANILCETQWKHI